MAPVRPRVTTIHKDTLKDHYHWLREKENPEVIAYLQAENAYTQAISEPLEDFRDTLYKEMLARIQETDLSVPVKIDDYFYYTRTQEGLSYPYLCRKTGSLDAPEQVLLDQNELARGLAYFRLGVQQVSPAHDLLAYSVDSDGSEVYTLYVKNLITGECLADEIANTYYSVVWGNDNQTLFYSVLDQAQRPYQLWRHTLGTPVSQDILVYEEPDEAFFLTLTKTRSRGYLILSLNSMDTSELWYLDANRPTGTFHVIYPRTKGHEYSVDHRGDLFYICTNENARDFKLITAPIGDFNQVTEHLAHRPGVLLEDVDCFQEYLVITERTAALIQIRVQDLQTLEEHCITFPDAVYTVRGEANPEFTSQYYRFSYTSLIASPAIYDYHLGTRQRLLKKQTEVRGFDPTLYTTERLWATAPDGTQIPISVAYRRDLGFATPRPAYLYGYGAYGVSMSPSFSSVFLSLMDRGFIYAIAHIRGGQEMGRGWYEAGKLLHKKNTFSDFIACAEHLIQLGYTQPEQLAICGGSAGGLLMGAVTNLRPDLFNCVVAHVPFVDVVNTMLDPSLPLTVIEYDEWGNPQDPEYYAYIKSYSPYDNVTAQAYPALFITAGLNDPRVGYWEPAKWAAQLRATKTDHNPLLLKINMGAGHGGPSGRYARLEEYAFEYAFVINQITGQIA